MDEPLNQQTPSFIKLSALAIVGLTLFWVPNGLANSGDLDPSFGTGGTVITDFGSTDRATTAESRS